MTGKIDFSWNNVGLMFFIGFLSAIPIFSQTEAAEDDIPPPPIVLTKDENSKLEAAQGIKERTQLSLQIAEMRLKQAEKLTEEADFDTALTDIGGYHAAIQTSLSFLQKNDNNDNKKVRDNFRRLETAIRGHVPRLEFLRRNTPGSHAIYIKKTLDFVRDARTSALESFFSDTILRDTSKKNENTFTAQPAKASVSDKDEEQNKPDE